MNTPLSLKQIVDQLGGEITNNEALQVSRVGSLAFAKSNAITFFNNTKYTQQLQSTYACAVILKQEHRHLTDLPKIIVDNPYAYFAKVSQLFDTKPKVEPGIHVRAVIDQTAVVPESCNIGANVTIAEHVVLGENVVIGAGSVVEQNAVIGDNSILEANVTVKYGSQIGHHCHLFSGAVIGNDGFGYAEDASVDGNKHWVKIPQVGGVVIEDYVDIGANTTVDRGAIDDTVIEEGSKIDNLVQIAHNCRIGAHSVIAGCVGVAGSASIGKHCKIGGAAMILGHLEIADQVTISPGSMITRSIRKSGTYTALMPFQAHDAWLKTAANIRHLDRLTDKIKSLENIIQNLDSSQK